jgi:hypothetical protein
MAQVIDCVCSIIRIARFRWPLFLFRIGLILLVSSEIGRAGASEPTQDRRPVVFGPIKDLVEMPVKKDCLTVDPKTVNVRTETLTFRVNPSGCFIYPAPEGYDYLAVDDLEPFTEPAEPQLPMKTFAVKLDRDCEVYGVEVVGGVYREVQQPVHIVPVPWLGFTNDCKYIPNAELYRASALFPGNLVACDRGNDNARQHVFVRFFPVQYIPGQRKAAVVTRATLRLYYGVRTKEGSAPLGKPGTRKKAGAGEITASKAACVIICPEALRQEAQRLCDFHTKVEGIASTVVTTEAIGAAYQSAGNPPFNGYANQQLEGWSTITNYHYPLAQQIVSYLRDQEVHPRLIYVTLVGDGLLVPPSYYYYWGKCSRVHQSWAPTDFFYASPDYDFVPNFAVGRLSVNNAAEAAHLVDKIIRWHANAKWEWFRNVWLVQGRPYDYLEDTGEMACDAAVEEGLFSGMRIKKLYRTNCRLEKAYVLPAYTSASVGIVNIGGCHGLANDVRLNSTIITGDDLIHCAPNDYVPVILSGTCNNGAFDFDLMDTPFTNSFGEAVLKSPAGGIAFFGQSRLASGTILYCFQRGEPRVTKVSENDAMMLYALRSYRRGSDTLGQLYSDALYGHVANNKMAGHVVNTQCVFPFILLGDPALRIPKYR